MSTRLAAVLVLGALLAPAATGSVAAGSDTGATSSTTVPFVMFDNRPMVRCTIDGRGPYLLVLDTGSIDVVLTTRVAEALRLPIRWSPPANAGGAGEHAVRIGSAPVRAVGLGTMTFHPGMVTVLDLGEIERGIGFPHLDGIIGYPALKDVKTEIDVDRRTVTLTRGALAIPAGARTVAFTGQLPVVAAVIDGVPGTVLVDTGDRSSFTLFAGFAKRHGYYERPHTLPRVLTGFGVGGPIYGDVLRLPRLQVFGATLRDVTTRASRQRAGVFKTAPQSGSIGGGVLNRFNVIYDYPRKTITAWPSRAHRVQDAYDRSGLWLSPQSDGDLVRGLVPNGPAARAGIRAGDVVRTINGRPTRAWPIDELRAYLARTAPGSRIRTTVRRNDRELAYVVTLRDQI
ncbi:MAG: aspartyl protease family protein [Candidatus Eremiobacteraeota bacterium]|nr:aspartyl protease family protein [Candidatus Eremiobacteraeota bacterium]